MPNGPYRAYKSNGANKAYNSNLANLPNSFRIIS